MQINPQIGQLEQTVKEFITCIQDLPEAKFSQPMNGWSPGDVLAHLIGWNRLYITGLREIKNGNLPSYFSDVENDFRHVNLESLEMYSSMDRDQLIEEMMVSSQSLENFLLFLDVDDWVNDFGVRFRDSTITIEKQVLELIRDYDNHRGEIQDWVKNQ